MSRPVIVTLALLFIASPSFAEPGQECDDQRRHPPTEAVQACEGLRQDDACSFEARDGDELVGSCFVPEDAPDDAPIACRPDNAPRGARR